MDTYYNIMFQIFSYGTLVLGALAVVLLVLSGIARIAVHFYDKLSYWRLLAWVVIVHLKGEQAATQRFWDALDEKARGNKGLAWGIIERAAQHLPADQKSKMVATLWENEAEFEEPS